MADGLGLVPIVVTMAALFRFGRPSQSTASGARVEEDGVPMFRQDALRRFQFKGVDPVIQQSQDVRVFGKPTFLPADGFHARVPVVFEFGQRVVMSPGKALPIAHETTEVGQDVKGGFLVHGVWLGWDEFVCAQRHLFVS